MPHLSPSEAEKTRQKRPSPQNSPSFRRSSGSSSGSAAKKVKSPPPRDLHPPEEQLPPSQAPLGLSSSSTLPLDKIDKMAQDTPDFHSALASLAAQVQQLHQVQTKQTLLCQEILEGRSLTPTSRSTRDPRLKEEDGRTMANFLQVMELEFTKAGIDQSMWAEEMRPYLVGPALSYWCSLRNSDHSLHDWPRVRDQFVKRFCALTADRQKSAIAALRWEGDHVLYTTQFASIVEQGNHFTPQQLLAFYMARLPEDIRHSITSAGSRHFVDWHAASLALADYLDPWLDQNSEWNRVSRELDEVERRERRAAAGQRDLHNQNIRPPPRRDNDNCLRCGGRGHYARVCPTQSSGAPQVRAVKQEDTDSKRLNGNA